MHNEATLWSLHSEFALAASYFEYSVYRDGLTRLMLKKHGRTKTKDEPFSYAVTYMISKVLFLE
jgi:hypothetical protein